MAATVLNFPVLPTGLTLTCDIRHISTLAVLEAVTLTETAGVYSGTASTAIIGQALFVVKSGSVAIAYFVRSIYDDVGPYVVLSEIEFQPSDGGGLNPVTITVDDGTDPLEGVIVRITATGVVATVATDVNGEAIFKLNDGDYDRVLSLGGYSVVLDTLTVSGTTTDSVSLTQTVVTPPDSALVSTGVALCYDEDGILEEGVSVSMQMTAGPGTDGYVLDTKIRTEVSDVNGLIQFTGMIRGATYRVWRGISTASTPSSGLNVLNNISRVTVTVPLDADSFSLPELLGADA